MTSTGDAVRWWPGLRTSSAFHNQRFARKVIREESALEPLRPLTERFELPQGAFLELQVRLNVMMGGLEPLVAEPQCDGGHVDAGLEQVHGGGVADDVGRHAFRGQAWISLASSLAGLIEQMGDALSRQAVAARVAERIVGCGLTLLVEPLAQTAAGPGPQGYGSLLASFPEELDDRGGAEAYVGAPQRNELGDTRPGVVQRQQEDVVPPTAVGRAVTAGQDGVHFRPRQVVDLSSWRALAGNRQDTRRQVETLRRAQRCEADEGADGGQTRIAGLNAVGAILFEVVEERQDHRRIEVVERECIGLPLTVLIEKREQQAEGVAIRVDGLRADGSLLHEMVGEERAEQRAERGTGDHGATFPSTNASNFAPAGSSTGGVAVRYQ